MAMIRRITEINGEIIVVETMIIVGEIVLITVQINGELVRYEILSVRQLGPSQAGLRLRITRPDCMTYIVV